MPTKIKFILTILVLLITSLIFFKHLEYNEFVRSSIILVVSIVMVLGLWILPEATGKTKETNEKK